jgi:IclR helix-turn-helix domain
MLRNGAPAVSVTLSPAQVEEVLRAASLSTMPSVSALIAGALSRGSLAVGGAEEHPAGSETAAAVELSDRRLSRSLLRGLSILTRFGPDHDERGIVEISRELGMSASTTHRYAMTLVALGLLERCPDSRKYRLPAGAGP